MRDIEAHVFANAYTSNLVPSSANSGGLGKKLSIEENYQQTTAKIVPDWDEFFGNTNEFTTWPRGGICFSSLQAVESLNMTAQEIGSDDAWQYLCGSGLKRTAFNLEHEFEGANCPANDGNCTGYQVATAVSGGINGVQLILNIVLGGMAVYYRTLYNRGNI